MGHSQRWVVIALAAGLALSACSKSSETDEGKAEPAAVESVDGSDAKRVVLTPEAFERVGIETVAVQDAPPVAGQPPKKIIPYAAVLYDENGRTWTYVSPEPRTFLRAPITVEWIGGPSAVLTDGPAAGTAVVTVGGAELLGAESGVGEG